MEAPAGSICAKLVAFADGELSSEDATDFRSHLKVCAPCRRELVEAVAISAQLSMRLDRAAAILAVFDLPADMTWNAELADRGEETESSDYVDGFNAGLAVARKLSGHLCAALEHCDFLLGGRNRAEATCTVLRRESEALTAVSGVAERVRDGRYNIKSKLASEDRALFDDLNDAVDTFRSARLDAHRGRRG